MGDIPSPPDIANAHWIWTDEQPHEQPPPGPRAFRKVAHITPGEFVDSMIIDITADNYYTLYVNGSVVGSTTIVGDAWEWKVVKRYSIKFELTDRVIISVYAANDTTRLAQAGVIASAVLWNSENNQGGTFTINTDTSWGTSNTATASGFEKFYYSQDASWGRARDEGLYGVAPWGAVAKPTTTSPVTGGFSGLNGIPDPPSAPLATPGPDDKGNTIL